MDEKSSPPSKARASMIGSAFAVVKNYFTPERATTSKTNQSVGITPLVRSFATLTLDDSSHDSTDSFRTTFSQQDDSFQSTASYVEQNDDYNYSPDRVADETVLVEETLLESSVNSSAGSIDVNCTVNDGIDNSVILVSDSNDSPQIIHANVGPKPVIINDLNAISAKWSSEYHKNIEDILEDVNDDGSILSDIQLMPAVDKINDNNKLEDSSVVAIDKNLPYQIETDSNTTLLNSIGENGHNSNGNIVTPISVKSDSFTTFSPIFIPDIVVTQVSSDLSDNSPLSEAMNSSATSFDSVIHVKACDSTLPAESNVNTITQIIADIQQDSDIVDHHLTRDIHVISTGITDEIPIYLQNYEPIESLKDSNSYIKYCKEEIIEDPCNVQISEIPYNVNVKKELPLESSVNVEGKLNASTDSLTTTVPLVCSVNTENSDILLAVSNGSINTTENELCADALLNATNETVKSVQIDALVTEESAETVLEIPIAPAALLETHENTDNFDTLLNITNEPLNNTHALLTSEALEPTHVLLYIKNEPSIISEAEESFDGLLNVINEIHNTTVPIVSSANSDNAEDALNITTDLLNTTVSLAMTENAASADALLNITVPIVSSANSDNAERALNIAKDPLNTTVPLPMIENTDDLLNVTSETDNTTVPFVCSENSEHAEGILNVTNDPPSARDTVSANVSNYPSNTSVQNVAAEDVDNADDFLKVSNQSLNTTVASVTSEVAQSSDTSLNVTNDALFISGPIVTPDIAEISDASSKNYNSSHAIGVTNVSPNNSLPFVSTDESLHTNVDSVISESLPVVSSDNSNHADGMLNVTDDPLNTTATLVAESENCVSADASNNADALIKVTNGSLYTNVDSVISETAPSFNAFLNDTSEMFFTLVPIVTPEITDSTDALLNTTAPSVAISENYDSADAFSTTNVSPNMSLPFAASNNADALVKVTDESLPTNVNSVISETVKSSDTSLNVTTTVPVDSSEISDQAEGALNVTNDPFNSTVPLATTDSADALIAASDDTLNATVPNVSSEIADATLNVSNPFLNTTVPMFTSDKADCSVALLNVTKETDISFAAIVTSECPNSADASFNETAISAASSQNADSADAFIAASSDPFNTSVPMLTSDKASVALLNATNEADNSIAAIVTSEWPHSTDASFNEMAISAASSQNADSADAFIAPSIVPLNTTVPSVFSDAAQSSDTAPSIASSLNEKSADTSVNADALLEVTDELLHTNVDSVISETVESSETSLNVTNEIHISTVPVVSTEISDIAEGILNVTNDPLNTTGSSVIPEPAQCFDASLNIPHETLYTTVPIVNAEIANATLNVSNSLLITTMPMLTSDKADCSAALLNATNETDNSIAAIVTSECPHSADALFNETVISAASSQNADSADSLVNATNELINTTASSVADEVTRECVEVVFNTPLLTSVPLVVTSDNSDGSDALLNTTTELINTTAPSVATETTEECAEVVFNTPLHNTVPFVVTSDNYDSADALLNTTYDNVNIIVPSVAEVVLNNAHEPLNTTVPLNNADAEVLNTTVPVLNTSKNSESDEVVSNDANALLNTSGPLVGVAENAESLGLNETNNATVPLDSSETTDNANTIINVTKEPINDIVALATFETIKNTDDILNITNEAINSKVSLDSSETTDNAYTLLNVTKELINDIVALATCEAENISNITHEAINSTVPLVSSQSTENAGANLNIAIVPIATLESSVNAEAKLNVTSDTSTTIIPVLALGTAESPDALLNDHINVTLPLVTTQIADNANPMLNITCEALLSSSTMQPVNTTASLIDTATVENLLNISNVCISDPNVNPESDKTPDDILNISNLQFAENTADRVFVNSTAPDPVSKNQDISNNTRNDTMALPKLAISSKDPLDVITGLQDEKALQFSESGVEQTNEVLLQATLEKSFSTIFESIPVSEAEFHGPIKTIPSDDSIFQDKCFDLFKNVASDACLDTEMAIGLPSLDLDEGEMVNDCYTPPKTQHFDTDAMNGFIKGKQMLTPISESRENSMIYDSPALNNKKIKLGENLNLLNYSMSNRLLNLQESTSMFDVSPINACSPLVSQSYSPITNSNSSMQEGKLLQSTPEALNVTCNLSDPNKTFVSDLHSKPTLSTLDTTHTITNTLNETQVLNKMSTILNETVTLSPFNSMNTTRTINAAEELTRVSDHNRTLLDSTIVIEKANELDPNATVLLSCKSELLNSNNLENNEDLTFGKSIKNQSSNITNLSLERKPLTSMENKGNLKLQNLTEMLFESNTHENLTGVLSDNNKNINMPVCVMKERSENNSENTMGQWLSSFDKNVFKSPMKSEILDSFDNPVFSNAADLDIFNTDFQPPTGVSGRESLYLKFDPLYSVRNDNDHTIFISPLLKSENTPIAPDVNNENSLEKLKAEVARLHELLNKGDHEANEKLSYLKSRNDEVNIKCQIEQEKLNKLEKNQEVLEEEIKKRVLTNQQMNALAVGYNEILSTVENDLQKMKEEKTDASAVRNELESSKQHLKSAEDAFLDVLAKYEKISATVPDLKANNEQKKKKISELHRESLRIDERIKYSESTLAAEMEEIRRSAKIDDEQFASETSRLTAQLRKTELTYKNTKDSFDNIVVENEKLANLCDDIIAGKS